MRPILFRLCGMPVHSYPAMLYLGLVAGLVVENRAAHASHADAFRILVATVILLLPALIGARLLYVASRWEIYRRNPRRIWNRNEGGASQYGGIILGLPFSVPLAHLLHLSWGEFWDAAAFTIVVGMVFTRVGCLLNGCCAGRRSNSWFALYLPNAAGVWARRLPTQCLEGALAAFLFVLAVEIRGKTSFPGALFWIIAAGYAAGRLALESTRETRPRARRLTIQHWVSLGLILLSFLALVCRWPES